MFETAALDSSGATAAEPEVAVVSAVAAAAEDWVPDCVVPVCVALLPEAAAVSWLAESVVAAIVDDELAD